MIMTWYEIFLNEIVKKTYSSLRKDLDWLKEELMWTRFVHLIFDGTHLSNQIDDDKIKKISLVAQAFPLLLHSWLDLAGYNLSLYETKLPPLFIYTCTEERRNEVIKEKNVLV